MVGRAATGALTGSVKAAGRNTQRGAMDSTQLAMQAVVLLAPYLTEAGKAVAKEAGEAAFNQVGALVSVIRRKFSSDKDTYAQQTLERLEQQPESEVRRQTLAEVSPRRWRPTRPLPRSCSNSWRVRGRSPPPHSS